MDYAKQYGAMHSNDKRFPGFSVGHYTDTIARLVEQHQPERMLDYGSGKGFQYLVRRYHEKWGGMLPYCYDIGVRQLQRKPDGLFGGVICTDVMEHIEESDVPKVLSDILKSCEAGGFLFLGISCRPTRKRLPDGRDVHVTIKPPSWWISQLKKFPQLGFDGKRGSTTTVPQVHVVVEWDIKGHFDEPDTPWDNWA